MPSNRSQVKENTNMLTAEQYADLKAKYDTYHEQRRAKFGDKPLTLEDQAQLPPSPTNDEISSVEVYEFVTTPPAKYFAYVREDERLLITWTGEKLGTVAFGRPYYSNLGDTRVPVSVKAINGRRYHGTFFKSSGDYARLKLAKGV
jgi:hypothetical protein